jgi:hypothetical protein
MPSRIGTNSTCLLKTKGLVRYYTGRWNAGRNDRRWFRYSGWHYALRSQWKWVATGVALGVALALGIVLFGERRYEAEGKLLIESPTGVSLSSAAGSLSALIGGGSPDLNTQVEVLLARPLLEKVQQQAGIDEPYRDFAKRFRATALRNTNVVQARHPIPLPMARNDWRKSGRRTT